MTEPTLTFSGLDHAALAARTRRWGWLQFLEYRTAIERAFLFTWLATALGNPVLYLSAMGLGLGALINQDIAGVPYLTYVAPGLIVATVATTGSSFGTWPIFSGFKWQRAYLAAQATPLEPKQLAEAETVSIAARLLIQGLLFWLVALLFGAWPCGWASLATVVAATAAGLAFFAPLMAYSATLKQEGIQFVLLQRLVIMPMFLFAGTFFPLASMPIYLQWIGWISPMWHATQLARMAAFGLVVPTWLVVVHVGFLAALIVGGVWAARRTFTRRLVG